MTALTIQHNGSNPATNALFITKLHWISQLFNKDNADIASCISWFNWKWQGICTQSSELLSHQLFWIYPYDNTLIFSWKKNLVKLIVRIKKGIIISANNQLKKIQRKKKKSAANIWINYSLKETNHMFWTRHRIQSFAKTLSGERCERNVCDWCIYLSFDMPNNNILAMQCFKCENRKISLPQKKFL